jgi:hypothetical protein
MEEIRLISLTVSRESSRTTAELGYPGILSCSGIVELVGMVSNTGKREDQRRVKDTVNKSHPSFPSQLNLT